MSTSEQPIIKTQRQYARVAGKGVTVSYRAVHPDGSWGTLWKRTEEAALASYARTLAMLRAQREEQS